MRRNTFAKDCHVKHKYAGPVNRRRSKAAFKRKHNDAESRMYWRLPEVSSSTPSIKTYQRSDKRPRVDANWSVQSDEPSTSAGVADVADEVNVNWPSIDPELESHQLQYDAADVDHLKGLDGYRIVDVHHFLQKSMNLQYDHSKKCTGGRIAFRSESFKGIVSWMTFGCTGCDQTWILSTEPSNKPALNKAFVWGTLTSGSYYAQTSHLLSVMDVHIMSSKLFRTTERMLGNVWEDHLWKEMRLAGAQERDEAIRKGNVSDDGVAFITVYVDGGWSKRSYGHNFNAASGAACIIGKHTKKCLFLGIKNKYCYGCQYYERNNMPTKDHNCFKNYEGSSTAMEAEIIVEGFSRSMDIHGLRFLEFIGDGDSSVYARLRERVSYGRKIKKLECKNHAIKNYTSALYKIVNNSKLPLLGRKLLKSKMQNLTVLARKSIIHNCINGNAANLRRDFKNSLLHVFGEHSTCLPYYCKWQLADSGEPDENVLDDIKKFENVWSFMMAALDLLQRKADRLLHNETNNCAENFMSLIAKFNCGKRLNLTKSGSFQRRTHIAALNQLSGGKWHSTAWKSATTMSPGASFKKYFSRLEKYKEVRKKHIRVRKLFKGKKQEADKDYGPSPDNPPPNYTESELKELCDEKITEFQVTGQDAVRIERETVGQHSNDLYNTYRENRLTASLFGMICKRRLSTPCHNHVKQVLYKTAFSSSDMAYGRIHENVAIQRFENEHGKKVSPSGLFVDVKYGFLGASPDGKVVDENAIVEVKCFPSIARLEEKNLVKIAETKKNFPLKNENGVLVINKRHNYYYQIQGQLCITGSLKCYFICFVDAFTPIVVLEVVPDQAFINDMIPKLVNFYKKCILPEIILRRIPSKMKCLDPAEMKILSTQSRGVNVASSGPIVSGLSTEVSE